MSTSASSVISEDEIVDELRAAWAEVSRGYARCWAAMAEVARRTTSGWESAEIAAGLTFTTRRADYELGCAQAVVDRGPGRDQSSACPNRSQRRRDHHPLSCLTNRRLTTSAAGPAWLCTRTWHCTDVLGLSGAGCRSTVGLVHQDPNAGLAWSPGRWLDEPGLVGGGDCLRFLPNPEFHHHPGKMCLDGRFADE